MILYILCLILFAVGLYGVFIKKDLIKMIIGINIMGLAVNLFLIMIGYKTGGRYPILSKEELHIAKNLFSQMVDPIPQALVLTAIVLLDGLFQSGS